MSSTINTGNSAYYPNTITGAGGAAAATGTGTPSTGDSAASSYEVTSGSSGAGTLHNPPFVADFGAPQNGAANSGASKISWLQGGSVGANGMDLEAGQATDGNDATAGQTGDQIDTIGQQQDDDLESEEDNPQVKAAADKLMQASEHKCGTSSTLQMSLSKSLGVSSKDASALVQEMGKGGDLGRMVATAIVLHDSAQGKGPGCVKGLQVPSEGLQEGNALLSSQPKAARENTMDEIKAQDDDASAGYGSQGFAQQTLRGYGDSVLSEGSSALQQQPQRFGGSYQA